ncbi:hypothetical protein EJ05DRAFT_57067 [Pseudovirgaria hyperparasitica]|uniref:Aminoglycoside phosphotransferase domain-containing protein n=1 Tax=Pseudovirgaria hyperparasitica TaxID=470096 RepID=A0A6A6W5D9_9PEZI|nr:uncharacterized protein EJ05DRAFT_57067 [Pseudovirgaria hyperparasitica]KAF2757150.1 hypothetical protein EJ05DRAFT_57067 [Pseudovirgaria hyperparasitica]
MVEQLHGAFFDRNSLPADMLMRCHQIAIGLYPHHQIEFPEKQGYCSYTLILVDALSPTKASKILQFKPPPFRINIAIADAAKDTYGPLAPAVKEIGSVPIDHAAASKTRLYVYEMEHITGTPLSCSTPTLKHRETLVAHFAHFIASAWPSTSQLTSQAHLQTGLIGSSIMPRLTQLAAQLPTLTLRHAAKRCIARVQELSRLPVVLNHGDLIASNIMVDARTGALCGLVDWAEGEHLPFGMCLYGLEYLLGAVDEGSGAFVYVGGAERLRGLFWGLLGESVPVLRCEEAVLRDAVRLARDVGVLLWFGFAFDEGRIDRVVDEVGDARECVLLRTFLGLNEDSRACL